MSQEEYHAQSIALKRIAALNVIDVEDVAVILKISPDRVRHMTNARILPHYKGENGKLYFKKSEIEDWQTKNRIATDSEITAQSVTRCATNRKRK